MARAKLTVGYVWNRSQCGQPLIQCRHCADAVISFSNPATVVSRVATTLAECTARWVQSTSDYDEIFAATMTSDWATWNKPVISRPGVGHTLYTGYDIRHPDGRVPRCPSKCGLPFDRKINPKSVRLTCPKCGRKTHVPKVKSNFDTPLGRRNIVKTPFPDEPLMLRWEVPNSPRQVPNSPCQVPNSPCQVPNTPRQGRSLSHAPHLHLPQPSSEAMTRSISLPIPEITIHKPPTDPRQGQASQSVESHQSTEGPASSDEGEEVEEHVEYSPVRYSTHKRRRKQ
jgi:hypothetical protein